MFESIIQDVRAIFRSGHMVSRLMLINFLVWAFIVVIKLIFSLSNGGHGVPESFDNLLHWFCMPAHLSQLVYQPWSPLTNIFLHEGFWHLFVNLMFLYMFGTIVGDLIGDRRVLPIYIIGGLMGAFLFMLSDLWKHYPSPFALGASGAVMAMAGAAVTLQPDYRVMLMFLGEVKLKYIVLVLLLLDLLGIAHDDNTGGHVAHIGGFAAGIFLITRLRDGVDLIERVAGFFDKISDFLQQKYQNKGRRPKMSYQQGNGQAHQKSTRSDSRSASYQEKLDAILDKIKEGGYESLTQEEKDFLFDASKR